LISASSFANSFSVSSPAASMRFRSTLIGSAPASAAMSSFERYNVWSSELVWLDRRSTRTHSSAGPSPARNRASAGIAAACTASGSEPSTTCHWAGLSDFSASGLVFRVGVEMPYALSSTTIMIGRRRSIAKVTAS